MNELIKAIEKGKLYNGYILCGREISSALEVARAIEKAVHTEAYVIEEPNMENIRVLQTNLMEEMQIGQAKVAIIYGDKLSDRCQNAMLKTIEEHRENVAIIIVTTNISNILPTIISRCITYYVPLATEENLMEAAGGSLLCARYAMGSKERAEELRENLDLLNNREELCRLMTDLKEGIPYYDKGINRDKARELIHYMMLFLRDCVTRDIHWFFDKKELVHSYINTFTTEQILAMIKEVKSAQSKLSVNSNINPALLLTSVQGGILEVINGNGNRGKI